MKRIGRGNYVFCLKKIIYNQPSDIDREYYIFSRTLFGPGISSSHAGSRFIFGCYHKNYRAIKFFCKVFKPRKICGSIYSTKASSSLNFWKLLRQSYVKLFQAFQTNKLLASNSVSFSFLFEYLVNTTLFCLLKSLPNFFFHKLIQIGINIDTDRRCTKIW